MTGAKLCCSSGLPDMGPDHRGMCPSPRLMFLLCSLLSSGACLVSSTSFVFMILQGTWACALLAPFVGVPWRLPLLVVLVSAPFVVIVGKGSSVQLALCLLCPSLSLSLPLCLFSCIFLARLGSRHASSLLPLCVCVRTCTWCDVTSSFSQPGKRPPFLAPYNSLLQNSSWTHLLLREPKQLHASEKMKLGGMACSWHLLPGALVWRSPQLVSSAFMFYLCSQASARCLGMLKMNVCLLPGQ